MSEPKPNAHQWKSADRVLAEFVEAGVASNLIENDPGLNHEMVDLFLAGEKMEGCVQSRAGQKDPYGHSAWVAYPRTRGSVCRVVYRGTLYQCAIARDCFWLLREPFARYGYGSRPGEQRPSFFLTKEVDITVRLSGPPPLNDFFSWIICRLANQGVLKLRAEQQPSGPTLRKEKPVPGLLMQAMLRERLDELYTRLEGIEQLLSERIPANLEFRIQLVENGLCQVLERMPMAVPDLPDAGHVLLDPTNEAGMEAALTSAPDNTKEPIPEFGIDAL